MKAKCIKEKLDMKDVILKYVDYSNMVADFLTKSISADKLTSLSSKSSLN